MNRPKYAQNPYNQYKSWVVGCDHCTQRAHVGMYGHLYTHYNKGVKCEGSGTLTKEFKERQAWHNRAVATIHRAGMFVPGLR